MEKHLLYVPLQTRTRQIRQLLPHLKRDLLGESPSTATAAQVPALASGAVELDASSGCMCVDDAASSMDERYAGSSSRNGHGSAAPASSIKSGGPLEDRPCLLGSSTTAMGSLNGSSHGHAGLPSFAGSGSTAVASAAGNGSGVDLAQLPPVIIAGDFNATPESVPCRVRNTPTIAPSLVPAV